MRAAMLAVLVAGGATWGQFVPGPEPKKPTPEEIAQMEAKQQKAWEKYLDGVGTEVPDVVAKAGKVSDPPKPPKLEIGKDDPLVMKAAKRAMAADLRSMDLIHQRIMAGSFTGGRDYVQMTNAAVSVYGSAQLVWDDPEKLLPWAEFQLHALASAERFNGPRVEMGVEEPSLLPQLQAARFKAEIVVLQLREKAKKK